MFSYCLVAILTSGTARNIRYEADPGIGRNKLWEVENSYSCGPLIYYTIDNYIFLPLSAT